MIKLRFLLPALAACLLAGCQSTPTKLELPAPLHKGKNTHGEQSVEIAPKNAGRTQTEVEKTPSPPTATTGITGTNVAQNLPPLNGPPVTANLNNLPLPSFLNLVYGHILHINYVLDPSLAKQTDLVTLNVTDPQPPKVFYQVVADVLQRYGIAITWDKQTKILNLTPAKQAAGSEPPILISGRALPSVPESHRPVFQLVQLHAVGTQNIAKWLSTAYNNDQLKIDQDIDRNAVVLSGPPELVQQAVKAVGVLDRPYLRGSHSRRIEPAFISAEDLAPRLVDSLRAEGYAASQGLQPNSSIIILPVKATNSLLVFAPDEKTLDHVIQWARTIDRPNPSSGKDSLFYYPVTNTKASDIASVLNGGGSRSQSDKLTMGSNTLPQGDNKNDTKSSSSDSATKSSGSTYNGVLTVDGARNALIFRGAPAEWQRMLPLIRQMDRPTRQVMIEVTIAEVSLDNDTQYGVNWLAYDHHGRFNGQWQLGQLSSDNGNNDNGNNGNSGAISSGLTYLVDVAGVNRAKLSALASDQRVTILSTPRLLVQSGQEASIDVGNDVPTLSAQTTSAQQTNGNSNLLQSIQYRKTGIILDVQPTVYSDNRIDLNLSLEVSEAQNAGSSSGVNSPSIFGRSVKTSLSLKDGGSVVLGGLVSSKETLGNSGIPFLKDIPVIGNLFKSHSKTKSRTELLMIIQPYIINSDQQAQGITQSIIRSMPSIDDSQLHKQLTSQPLKRPGSASPEHTSKNGKSGSGKH